MSRSVMTLGVTALVACGPIGPRDVGDPRATAPKPAKEQLAAPGAARLVVVERAPGNRGTRLVLADECGRRQAVLTDAPVGEPSLDLQPAWSPDGRWVVFASTRGRGGTERYSLWIVSPLVPDAQPVRLTTDDGVIDWQPAWTPRGDAIVFASTRATGSFDLWRLDLEGGDETRPPRAGKLSRLSDAASEDWEPAVSPDGQRIVFTAIADGRRELRVMPVRGGASVPLGEGEAAAWAPDGRSLVFARKAAGRDDRDIWRMDDDGQNARVLVDESLGDELAPRLSSDGRTLLGASFLRNADGQVVLATLLAADLQAKAPRWRALVETTPAGRMAVDPAPVPLVFGTCPDGPLPTYTEAVKRTLRARGLDGPDADGDDEGVEE